MNSEVFLFTDDPKLIKIIRTEQDAINLKSVIDNLQIWCNLNFLFLIINKCKYTRCCLIKNRINY